MRITPFSSIQTTSISKSPCKQSAGVAPYFKPVLNTSPRFGSLELPLMVIAGSIGFAALALTLGGAESKREAQQKEEKKLKAEKSRALAENTLTTLSTLLQAGQVSVLEAKVIKPKAYSATVALGEDTYHINIENGSHKAVNFEPVFKAVKADNSVQLGFGPLTRSYYPGESKVASYYTYEAFEYGDLTQPEKPLYQCSDYDVVNRSRECLKGLYDLIAQKALAA